MINEHSLTVRPSMGGQYDAECECTDPDYESGWSGIEGIFAASFSDIEAWYEDHLDNVVRASEKGSV